MGSLEGRPHASLVTDHQTRRCIVCRERGPKAEFLRFIERAGCCTWDESQNQPGRGAYVHRRLECISKMAGPKMWEHAFRLKRGGIAKDKLVRLSEEMIGLIARGV